MFTQTDLDDLPTSDAERRAFIAEYVSTIDDRDIDIALAYLPLAYADQEDAEFERYFQLLQRMYNMADLAEDAERSGDADNIAGFQAFLEETKQEAEYFGLPTAKLDHIR